MVLLFSMAKLAKIVPLLLSFFIGQLSGDNRLYYSTYEQNDQPKTWIWNPQSGLCTPLLCHIDEVCLLDGPYTAQCVNREQLHKSGERVISYRLAVDEHLWDPEAWLSDQVQFVDHGEDDETSDVDVAEDTDFTYDYSVKDDDYDDDLSAAAAAAAGGGGVAAGGGGAAAAGDDDDDYDDDAAAATAAAGGGGGGVAAAAAGGDDDDDDDDYDDDDDDAPSAAAAAAGGGGAAAAAGDDDDYDDDDEGLGADEDRLTTGSARDSVVLMADTKRQRNGADTDTDFDFDKMVHDNNKNENNNSNSGSSNNNNWLWDNGDKVDESDEEDDQNARDELADNYDDYITSWQDCVECSTEMAGGARGGGGAGGGGSGGGGGGGGAGGSGGYVTGHVCASDNHTYKSLCHLTRHNCLYSTAVYTVCHGHCPCPTATTPATTATTANNNNNNNSGESHSPPVKLETDGGELMCSDKELSLMGTRLLDWFTVIKQSRSLNFAATKRLRHRLSAAHPPTNCKREAVWMWRHLDVDGDNQLTLAELQTIEGGSSERCVQQYLDKCDSDGDMFLSGEEWCVCFAQTLRPCEARRQQVKHLLGAYVPSCDADGYYRPVQCHTASGYCWCSDRHGLELAATRVQHRAPVCHDDETEDDDEDTAVTGSGAGYE